MACFASPQLRTFGAYMAGTRRTSGYRICECSSAHVGSHVDIVSDAFGRKRLKYNHEGWGTWEYYARNPASVPSAPETKQAWRVNYIRRGETGPPIVFVHGFGASSFHWRYSLAKTTVLLICCPPSLVFADIREMSLMGIQHQCTQVSACRTCREQQGVRSGKLDLGSHNIWLHKECVSGCCISLVNGQSIAITGLTVTCLPGSARLWPQRQA